MNKKKLAEELAQYLSTPIQLDPRHQAHTTASIGIAENTPHTPSDQTMMRADAAMYFAKRSGRNRVTLYQKGMEEHLLKNSLIVQYLESGLANNELKLYHQVIF